MTISQCSVYLCPSSSTTSTIRKQDFAALFPTPTSIIGIHWKPSGQEEEVDGGGTEQRKRWMPRQGSLRHEYLKWLIIFTSMLLIGILDLLSQGIHDSTVSKQSIRLSLCPAIANATFKVFAWFITGARHKPRARDSLDTKPKWVAFTLSLYFQVLKIKNAIKMSTVSLPPSWLPWPIPFEQHQQAWRPTCSKQRNALTHHRMTRKVRHRPRPRTGALTIQFRSGKEEGGRQFLLGS